MSAVGLTYLVLILIAYGFSSSNSPEKTRKSLKIAGLSLWRLFPLLVAVFGLVGLFQVFIPPELIEKILGESSGPISLLLGGGMGAIAIGPPAAAFPLAGTLLSAGAWPPAIAAFIVSWVSVGVVTLPFEVGVFGARFALLRNGIAFIAALVIGLLMGGIL
ncbi:permease [Desulfuromonas sp. AOP6]|uniref:permease n=1 Tax=Desulfuromonas sp. AOP6 TaxID=1566351 RepID=UPI00126F4D0C|nr:permease [Desulfuromonas sp. AOP6]BCA80970.1 hypothetical protein AOP6_2757 [Desulfuromonas sp. AOP6]